MITNSRESMKLGYLTARGGFIVHCTENRIYVIPRNETARPHSKLLHSFVCERFIYLHDLSAYFWMQQDIDRPILEIYIINHSLIHECGNWEREHYNSVLEISRQHSFYFLGIHKWEQDIYIGFSCSVWNCWLFFFPQNSEM